MRDVRGCEKALHKPLGNELAHVGQRNAFNRPVNADFDGTKKFMDHLKSIKLATSLGGVTSLANQPITNTHAALNPEERAKAGISESLVRLSVGIENVQSLIKDLEQALKNI